ncbi:conjugative transposon protein TraN [Paraflavitalea sp. CAU 1676]|uniref:conjugative transposon protein TraN n=1 Tax=Paraflavitalea sp. CAU 1676 TaxID=3032598 RepID=UPI0023DC7496|nr:conjugative transposon protein TraN [Paraflavitalea sp. CAU 1676]MDF2190502.1 conjugative transposon protein TraN [Paraflavitalea sp. CAU 1676]
MKDIISTLVFLIISALGFAQVGTVGTLQPINTHHIEIGDRATTVIIFPWAIKDVDRGIKEIAAFKSPNVENILRVKAKQPFTTSSNLHVITSDGIVYPFTISYKETPANTTYNVNLTDSSYSLLRFQNASSFNNREIRSIVQQIKNRGTRMHRRIINGCIKLSISGIFLKDNSIYLKTEFQNRTLVPFEVDWAKLYITDKKQAKNTSKQSSTIDLVYKDDLPVVTGKGIDTWIVAFKQRSIPRGRKLILEVQEKNGGRNLIIEIRNKDLYKAIKL